MVQETRELEWYARKTSNTKEDNSIRKEEQKRLCVDQFYLLS